MPLIKWPAVALLLAVATTMAYWKIWDHSFINYDDNLYVTANPAVQSGLTPGAIRWAFTTTHTGNWIPLSWVSHEIDCQLFGPDAGGHHVTNLVLHILNTLLLFFLLGGLTGALWRSGLVAALFAIHPLNVESVAWIAERKSVLCMMFWLLTTCLYAWYASRPRIWRYLLTLFAFALALMAKPMAVTLPFALMLFDYWPLDRLKVAWAPQASSVINGLYFQAQAAPLSRLFVEKIPFLMLSLANGIITVIAQKQSRSIGTTVRFPFRVRLANAVISYAEYLKKTVWPSSLAVFYPYPKSVVAWEVVFAVAVILAITLVALRCWREMQFVTIGWFWFLGVLVPVIGLVQVGGQSMADRYAYFSLIGIFMIASWGLQRVASRFNPIRNVVIGFAIAAVLGLGVVTHIQLGYWRDSVALFEHAQSVTRDNFVAYTNLGEVFAGQGKVDDAARWFTMAVAADPSVSTSHENLGMILFQKGDVEGGIAHLRTATELDPMNSSAYNKLGAALTSKGNYEEALICLRRALEIDPNLAPALANMGNVLAEEGKTDEAVSYFRKALAAAKGRELSAQIHYRLGTVLLNKGASEEAALEYRDALKLKPDYAPALQALRSLERNQR